MSTVCIIKVSIAFKTTMEQLSQRFWNLSAVAESDATEKQMTTTSYASDVRPEWSPEALTTGMAPSTDHFGTPTKKDKTETVLAEG